MANGYGSGGGFTGLGGGGGGTIGLIDLSGISNPTVQTNPDGTLDVVDTNAPAEPVPPLPPSAFTGNKPSLPASVTGSTGTGGGGTVDPIGQVNQVMQSYDDQLKERAALLNQQTIQGQITDPDLLKEYEASGGGDQMAWVTGQMQSVTKNQADLAAARGEMNDGKWGLDDVKDILGALAAGMGIWQVLDNMSGGGDAPSVNPTEVLKANLEAITDPEVRARMQQTQFEDQPTYVGLEQMKKFQRQHGLFSSTAFNDPEYGAELKAGFDQARAAAAAEGRQLTQEEYMLQVMREHPTHPASVAMEKALSGIGQIERSTAGLGQIRRGEQMANLAAATDIYAPLEEGGFGYKPSDFRAPDVQKSVDYALGRAFGPEATQLRKSIFDDVATGGRLGDQALTDLRDRSLAGLSPEMQNQSMYGKGGLAEVLLNTEEAQRKRRQQSQQMGMALMAQERAYATPLAGVMQAASADPLTLMGVQGTSTGAGANVYAGSGTDVGSAMYDPTTGYAGSMASQMIGAEQDAWENQQSVYENLNNLTQQVGRLEEAMA